MCGDLLPGALASLTGAGAGRGDGVGSSVPRMVSRGDSGGGGLYSWNCLLRRRQATPSGTVGEVSTGKVGPAMVGLRMICWRISLGGKLTIWVGSRKDW